MSSSNPPSKPDTIQLRLALGRVAELQGELAASASRIENAVSYLVTPPDTEHQILVDLQELDLARQSLENLGRLLTTLASHVPDHVHVPAGDVRASLNLGAMIRAVLHGSAAPEPEDSGGEIHLFDFG